MTRIYIDTETTSKYPKIAHVLEVGACVLDDAGAEVGVFEQLVNPGPLVLADRSIDEALAINHITREMLKGETFASGARARLFAFLTERAQGAQLHAFNVGYDGVVLARAPWGIPTSRWGECIMLAARDIMGPAGALPRSPYGDGWKWPKLSEAAAFFGVVVDGDAHRALTDARTAAGVHAAILRRRSAVTK